MIGLKVKRLHPDASLPTYGSDGAACFDLIAIEVGGVSNAEREVLAKFGADDRCDATAKPGNAMEFRTGLAVEIPPGWVMLIYSRSGHGFRSNTRLSNCVGVIDSDYRGEIKVKLTVDEGHGLQVRSGDRIAQAMLVPIERVAFREVDELSDTARGTGGFGSTGA